MAHKVQGFNPKEQRLFNKFVDGKEHDIRALKMLFRREAEIRCGQMYEKGWGGKEIDAQCQSYVRNSIRRLIRDGWVEQVGRGTYKMTRVGKNRVAKGVDVTVSFTESKRGKDNKSTAKKAKPKAAKKAKPKAAKKQAKKAKSKATKKQAKKAKASKGNGVRKVSADKVKAMKAKTKVAAAKEKFADTEAN